MPQQALSLLALIAVAGAAEAGSAAEPEVKAGPASVFVQPLAEGAHWDYRFRHSSNPQACLNDTGSSTVVRKTTVAGREAFEVTNPCGPSGITSYQSIDAQGNIYGLVGTTWYMTLAQPAYDGQGWYNGFFFSTWKAAGDVDVEAGHFIGCWEATQAMPSGPRTMTFCPGVGMVREHDLSVNYNNYEIDMELVSYGLGVGG